MDTEDTITISKKEYNDLTRAQRKLNALEAGGVDNWEWYGDSLESFWEEEDKREDEKKRY